MHIKEAWLKGLIDKGCARCDEYTLTVPATGIDVGEDGEPYRSPNIGMSRLEDCPRLIWVDIHHPVEIFGYIIDELELAWPTSRADEIQNSRRFRMGHIIEAEIIHWLRLAGGHVTDTQTRMVDFNKRLKGFTDAVLNDQYVIEIKGLKGDKCDEMKQLGFKVVYPNYYTQINLYMYYRKLKEGFLTVYNKNTSEIIPVYQQIDIERVTTRRNKAFNIISAPELKYVRIDRAEQDCERCYMNPVCDKLPCKVGV